MFICLSSFLRLNHIRIHLFVNVYDIVLHVLKSHTTLGEQSMMFQYMYIIVNDIYRKYRVGTIHGSVP